MANFFRLIFALLILSFSGLASAGYWSNGTVGVTSDHHSSLDWYSNYQCSVRFANPVYNCSVLASTYPSPLVTGSLGTFNYIVAGNGDTAQYHSSGTAYYTAVDCIAPLILNATGDACVSPPPPACPVDTGFVAGPGCLPTAVCANSCTYPISGSQHCTYSILGVSMCVYDGYKSGGSPGCHGPYACQDAIPPNKPPDLTGSPLTVDLPALTPQQLGDAAAAAAAKALADANAAAAAAAANPTPDTTAAALAAQQLHDAAAAHADALIAAAAAASANNLAVTTAKQAAADSQAAADAIQKAAADAANPQASAADIAASQAAAQAAIDKAAASAVIQGTASNTALADKAAADKAAAAAAGVLAKQAAAAAGASDGGAAAGIAGAAAAAGAGANPTPDFCALHPASSICTTSQIGSGSCANGAVTGFSCTGDAIQCANALTLKQHYCASIAADPQITSDLQTLQSENDGHLNTAASSNHIINNVSSSLDTSSTIAAVCPVDKTVSVLGQSVTFPISNLCPWLAALGYVFEALAFITAAKILGGSV